MKKAVYLVLFILIIFTAGCKKEKPQAVYRYYETDGVRVGRMYDGTVLDKFSSYYQLIESEREEVIIISTTRTIKNFEFINVIFGIRDSYYPADVLYALPELTPEIPFEAMTIISTDIPRRGISFTDDSYNRRYFYILKDSEDNSLILKEFFPFEEYEYHQMSEPDYYDSGDEKLYPDYDESEMPKHTADDLIYTTWKFEAGSPVLFFFKSFYVDFGEPDLVNVWGYKDNGESYIERTASWNVSNGNKLIIDMPEGTLYFTFYIEDEVLTIIDSDNDIGRFRRVYPLG